MPYNEYGSGTSAQEEQWLDDLKSLLDDQPGSSQVSAGKSGYYNQNSGYAQPQNGQSQNPGYGRIQNSRPQDPGYGHSQNGYPRNSGYQQNADRMPYGAQTGVPRWQPYGEQVLEDAPAEKKGYGSIIGLSLTIALEAAAIAALAIHWIQWMA